ncbi:MAG: glycosyltransferase family 2 protein [Steroidobacteraceae bacterium]
MQEASFGVMHLAAPQRSEESIQISIPLCTFNGAKYLRLQMDSVLAQTFSCLEVIAVDDGSTDETVAILQDYAARDPRVKVVCNPANLGFRANFEYAMSLCSGQFIAPCDQDDVWLPNKLQRLMGAMGDHALAYCDSTLIDGDGRSMNLKMSDMLTMPSTDDRVVFAFDNCVSGHAMLFRRHLLQDAFPVPSEFFYDWWLAALATGHGGIVFVDQPLVEYRRHVASVTGQIDADTPVAKASALPERLRKWRDTGRRIELLAALPGGQRQFLHDWSELWKGRETQWFSPALAWWMLRHCQRIHLIKGQLPASKRHLWRRMLRYIVGFKVKRLQQQIRSRSGGA